MCIFGGPSIFGANPPPLLGSWIQYLVQKTHGSHHTTDNSAQWCEKSNVPFSVSLYNLDVQWRDFVEEKDPGETCFVVANAKKALCEQETDNHQIKKEKSRIERIRIDSLKWCTYLCHCRD